MKRYFISKNLAGFVTFYFALCIILVYSNIVRTYEMLLTYDLRTTKILAFISTKSRVIRNIFRSQMKMLFLISDNLLCSPTLQLFSYCGLEIGQFNLPLNLASVSVLSPKSK